MSLARTWSTLSCLAYLVRHWRETSDMYQHSMIHGLWLQPWVLEVTARLCQFRLHAA